jgi:3-hydroxyisobutyrate dehydrogenase
VYDINKLATANLVKVGAKCASSLAEMSRNVDVVMSMLPSNQHVLDVYTDENGVLK